MLVLMHRGLTRLGWRCRARQCATCSRAGTIAIRERMRVRAGAKNLKMLPDRALGAQDHHRLCFPLLELAAARRERLSCDHGSRRRRCWSTRLGLGARAALHCTLRAPGRTPCCGCECAFDPSRRRVPQARRPAQSARTACSWYSWIWPAASPQGCRKQPGGASSCSRHSRQRGKWGVLEPEAGVPGRSSTSPRPR